MYNEETFKFYKVQKTHIHGRAVVSNAELLLPLPPQC